MAFITYYSKVQSSLSAHPNSDVHVYGLRFGVRAPGPSIHHACIDGHMQSGAGVQCVMWRSMLHSANSCDTYIIYHQ